MRLFIVGLAALTCLATPAHAQNEDPFRPIDDLLPAPSAERSVTGRPGPGYWQQRADFDIKVAIDVAARSYDGTLSLTYTNNSPDTLTYIYFLLDQNRFEDPAAAEYMQRLDRTSRRGGIDPERGVAPKWLRRWQGTNDNQYGFRDLAVSDRRGNALPFSVDGTIMRVDLREPLRSGRSVRLDIDFAATLVDADAFDGRSGYEILDDGTPIFGLAHWFPRPAAYTDYRGWHVEPFIEQGEFTTEFGDYRVAITVPDTYIVASTGTLDNPRDVLTAAERERLAAAADDTSRPTTIVTADEADARRSADPSGTKTWVFEAENVRDFAFAASPAFLWDAMAVAQPGTSNPTVIAQSYWPREGGEPWARFSTESVAQALEVFSEFTFPYPWPQATAVNGVINSGMEYPMISFNAPRPHPEDVAAGIYTARDKYRVIGIVIHETGHMYMPMIVNSDERLWMWQDEGMVSFIEGLANMRFEPTFSEGLRGRGTIAYMARSDDQPIMSSSDSLRSRGALGYTKPATALFVLRELVLGREAFDRAFRAYAQAWSFKRPLPSDFFRIMEQESGQDLDWFWRAWFYGTDHVDIAVEGITSYDFTTADPQARAEADRASADQDQLFRSFEDRNAAEGLTYRTDRRAHLRDIYTENDQFTLREDEKSGWEKPLDKLREADHAAYDRAVAEGLVINVVDLKNIGGVPTPVPLVLTYADGTTERLTLPVHIWRLSPETSRQLFPAPQAIVAVRVDPDNLMADADTSNNAFPRTPERKTIGVQVPDTSRPKSLMREQVESGQDEE